MDLPLPGVPSFKPLGHRARFLSSIIMLPVLALTP